MLRVGHYPLAELAAAAAAFAPAAVFSRHLQAPLAVRLPAEFRCEQAGSLSDAAGVPAVAAENTAQLMEPSAAESISCSANHCKKTSTLLFPLSNYICHMCRSCEAWCGRLPKVLLNELASAGICGPNAKPSFGLPGAEAPYTPDAGELVLSSASKRQQEQPLCGFRDIVCLCSC